jgi:hypothetical protein
MTRENFYKFWFWFKSIQSLFAKVSNKNRKEKTKKIKKIKRDAGQSFGPSWETAHGPKTFFPNHCPPSLFRSPTRLAHLSSLREDPNQLVSVSDAITAKSA